MSDDGIFLGVNDGGDVVSDHERGALIIGPTRSGKTTSIIIPNLLLTSRAVVTTSTKPDVVAVTSGMRRDVTTLLFDPSGETPAPTHVRRVGYSPLISADSWDRSVLITRSLVAASRMRVDGSGDHWTERAAALVAPVLHAGALASLTLTDVVNQIDARVSTEAIDVLRHHYDESHPAVATITGVLATEARELSSIWSTAAGLFAGLRTLAARTAASLPSIDVPALLDGGHHLHIVAPRRHHAVSAPLVIGLIDEVVHVAYQRHASGPGLLLALDELANVAPLPDLASIVSEGGGQGVLTLACLQDLSQARSRWGAEAGSFPSLFPTTVVLPGIADRHTLDLIASLGGRHLAPTSTLQHSRRRRRGHSTAWVERDRLSTADVAHGRPGYALTIGPSKQATWTRLAPFYRDSRFAPERERPVPPDVRPTTQSRGQDGPLSSRH